MKHKREIIQALALVFMLAAATLKMNAQPNHITSKDGWTTDMTSGVKWIYESYDDGVLLSTYDSGEITTEWYQGVQTGNKLELLDCNDVTKRFGYRIYYKSEWIGYLIKSNNTIMDKECQFHIDTFQECQWYYKYYKNGGNSKKNHNR